MAQTVYLTIDISDAKAKIDQLRSVHTKKEMDLILRRALRRTGSRVKTILRTELPKKYEVRPSWVGSQVGSPKVTLGGGVGASCIVPINGERGSLGGRFSATGGRHGWRGITPGRRYKINARIVKGRTSVLPEEMSHQGSNPPFRNFLATQLNGVVFTRVGRDRLPIVRVAGIGVPQMPLNLAKDDVQDSIMDTLMKRLEAEHNYIVSRCR